MRVYSNRSSWLPLWIGMALACRTADAQQPASTGLEEIIVTAQKRAERILDVPIAISAISDETLRDTGATQLSDFLESSPGVGIVDDGSGTQQIQIRGISSTYGNAPVGYYLDELPFTYLGNTQVPDVRTYDLERVEILRGPQGTLYGDGSIGGTIRILTREPDLESFQASVDVTGFGTEDGDESYAAKGMLNMPIKQDVLGLRLVASREELGGWVDNTATGEKDYNDRDIDNYRGKLRWDVTDRLDIVLSAWHTKEESGGTSESLEDRTSPVPPELTDTEYDLYSATVRYSFDAFDLVSATSWMDYSNDYVTDLFGPFTIFEEQDLLTEELRLTSTGDGMFRWTAGFFYRTIERDTDLLLAVAGFTQDQHQESDSYAVFGEATWSLLDRKLDFTLGLRYFEDDRVFDEVLSPELLGIIQIFDPDFTPRTEPTFDSTNPRLNIAYRPNDDWMVYTNVAKGFRTGQAQPGISLGLAAIAGVSIPNAIDPETLWSYEVGAKGTFADGRASLEGAVYYNDWDDVQVVVVVDPVFGVAALVNGGKARSVGAELAFAMSPIDGLDLRLGAGYVDAQYSDDVAGTPIQDGDRIVGVPETTVSASATWRWSLTSSLTGFAYGGAQYTSDRTDVASGALPSDSMTRLDARLGIEGRQWGAYLFSDNLTDEDGAVDVRLLGADGPATRLRPRTIGLNLRYSFD
jgi:iron complex outermembrane receptor protein